MIGSSLSVTSTYFTNNGIESFLVIDGANNNNLITNNSNLLQKYGLFNGNLFLGSI